MILKTCPPLPWTRWSFALPRGMRPCGHAGRAHEKGDRSPRHEQPAVHLGPAQHAKPFSRSHECGGRSEEHTSELQSLMRISYAVFCLKKKKYNKTHNRDIHSNKQL